MSNQYGVVKVLPFKEVPRSPKPFPDANAALEFLRRRHAALTGDASNSVNWPKITKCFQRDGTVVFDARDKGFEASISFGINAIAQKHSYTLKSLATQGVEKGSVDHVEILSDSTLKEPEWLHSEAYALAPYPYRYVVFTRAETNTKTSRVWLVGVSEFAPPISESDAQQSE
jgi:hypothetical protein